MAMLIPGSNAIAVLKVSLQLDRGASFDLACLLALRQTCTALRAAVNETLTQADLFRRPMASLQTFLSCGWPETVTSITFGWNHLDEQDVLLLPQLQALNVRPDSMHSQGWDLLSAHVSQGVLHALASAADICPHLRFLSLQDIDPHTSLQTLCTKRWVTLETLKVDLSDTIDVEIPVFEGVGWDSSLPNLKELVVKIGIRKDLPMGNDNKWCPTSLFNAELPSLRTFCWGDYVSRMTKHAHVGDSFLEELATASWLQRLAMLELHFVEAENVTPLIEAINASTTLEFLDLKVCAPRCLAPLTCPSLKQLYLSSAQEYKGYFSFFENANLPNLEYLSLYSAGDEIVAIADVTPTALPKLKDLNVHSPFWGDSWYTLGYMAPQLTSLILSSDFGFAPDLEMFGIEEELVEYFLEGLRERCSELFPGSNEQHHALPLEIIEIEDSIMAPKAMQRFCSQFLSKCNALRELKFGATRQAVTCIAAAEQGQTWPCLEVLELHICTAEEARTIGSKAHHWKIHTLNARINTSNGHENTVKRILADAFSGGISSCFNSIVSSTVICKFVCCPKLQE